jgi:hypothetical protein
MRISRFGIGFLMMLLAACGTRSSGSIAPTTGIGAAPVPVARSAQPLPAQIMVTNGDITERPYRSLGDVSATVAKWTIFDADPTREQVNQALQQKAAELGADAVILVRYGTVGIGVFTWGKLEGNGRAIAFNK